MIVIFFLNPEGLRPPWVSIHFVFILVIGRKPSRGFIPHNEEQCLLSISIVKLLIFHIFSLPFVNLQTVFY